MRRLVWVLTVLLAVLWGCRAVPQAKVPKAPQLTKTVYIDPEFKWRERMSIMDAMNHWSIATMGLVEWKVVDKCQPLCAESLRLIRAKSTSPLAINFETEYPPGPRLWTLAFTDVGEGTAVFLWDRIKPEVFTAVAEHEMGHLLGLNHLSRRHPSIMARSMKRSAGCITKTDLTAFCLLYGCDPTVLRPCD